MMSFAAVSLAQESGVHSGVFYLGLHNLVTGYVSNLYIGDLSSASIVLKRQKRYMERIMGLVPKSASANNSLDVYLCHSDDGDPVWRLALAELSREGARRYFDLKGQAQSRGVPFFGIVSEDVGKTDILYPIDPDTGELHFSFES